MTATMRAARFNAEAKSLEVREVPVPEIRPHEVLVRVQACGVCLSDIHLIDGSLPGPLPEVTPGHEPAGVIEAVGDAVPMWQPGQRVLMAAGRPCLTCVNCASGSTERCLNFEIMGFNYDGAWADYVVVPFAALVAVPDSIPIEQAAILADAVSTPFAAITDRAQVRPGEAVGIWGIGGLGIHAVKIASARSRPARTSPSTHESTTQSRRCALSPVAWGSTLRSTSSDRRASWPRPSNALPDAVGW